MNSTNDTDSAMSFLGTAETTPVVQDLYDGDLEEHGFVMNMSRLWAHMPTSHDAVFGALGQAIEAGGLTFRQRGILVAACASTLGDSYCSMAWGARLANETGADAAAGVLLGNDEGLDPTEQILAKWARQVTRDPNSTTAGDVQALRDAGFDDTQIFAITLFVSLRLAVATVNDALGARPDRTLADEAPAAIRDAIDFGRPIGEPGQPSGSAATKA